jgi:hypothetical protein
VSRAKFTVPGDPNTIYPVGQHTVTVEPKPGGKNFNPVEKTLTITLVVGNYEPRPHRVATIYRLGSGP